jgi:predicted DNA-binding ribbon-helix-helix protein
MAKNVVRSIRLDEDVYDKIVAKAKADDRTFAAYVAKLLREKSEEK